MLSAKTRKPPVYYSPRFRPAARRAVVLLIGALAIGSAETAHTPAARLGIAGAALLGYAMCEWAIRRSGVALDSAGIVLQNMFRTVRFGWDEVEALSLERLDTYYGGRIVLHPRHGKPTDLPAVVVRRKEDVLRTDSPRPGLPTTGDAVTVLTALVRAAGGSVPLRGRPDYAPVASGDASRAF